MCFFFCFSPLIHLNLHAVSHSFFLTFLFDVLFSVPNDRVDPLTSSESVDDSIPNLNPFLSNSVDAVSSPPLSSDAVSFSSRTPSHEMFSGKLIFFCPSQHSLWLPFCLLPLVTLFALPTYRTFHYPSSSTIH